MYLLFVSLFANNQGFNLNTMMYYIYLQRVFDKSHLLSNINKLIINIGLKKFYILIKHK